MSIRFLTIVKLYQASQSFVPEVRIVRLISPVMARYLRLYPTGCIPSQCCLAVEIYGCDPSMFPEIKNVPYVFYNIHQLLAKRALFKSWLP